jgi:hypothetical protein
MLNDLLAWRETQARKPTIHFRRGATGEEVAFVIESGRRLCPVEVKAGPVVRVSDAGALDALTREFGARAPLGLLVYTGAEAVRLTARTIALPLGALL